MSSTWQQIKARREQRDIRGDTAVTAAMDAIRGRSFDGFSLPALPAVGPKVGEVRILNPDGSLRESLTAEAFRARRQPADEAEQTLRKTRRQRGGLLRWARKQHAHGKGVKRG